MPKLPPFASLQQSFHQSCNKQANNGNVSFGHGLLSELVPAELKPWNETHQPGPCRRDACPPRHRAAPEPEEKARRAQRDAGAREEPGEERLRVH